MIPPTRREAIRRGSRGGPTVAALAACLFLTTAADAGDRWPRFRGPNGQGRATDISFPPSWTDERVAWRTDLPGGGHGSPVVWGNRIFLVSAEPATATRYLLCVDATSGSLLWKRVLGGEPFKDHEYNSFASATPAVDGDRVYITWMSPRHHMVYALDHKGNRVWKRDLGPFKAEHGGGASPMVYKNRVVVTHDQQKGGGDSFVAALDRTTGETMWRLTRESTIAAYSTPCVRKTAEGEAELMLTSNAEGITAVDPSTGEVRWQVDDIFGKRCVSSPVLADGLVFGSCGYGGEGSVLAAVRPGDSGDGEVAYEVTKGAPYVPTPVVVDGRQFVWTDGGVVSCLRASSGEVIWRERVPGKYFASPIAVDGKILNVSRGGTVVTLPATGDFEILGKTDLGERSNATPAVAHGRLYFRTFSQLLAVNGTTEE